MTNIRNYPNIEFVDTDTQKLVDSLIVSYEMFTGRTLYPADPTRLFILWIADIIIQERIIIDSAAKQNLPRYAEGINLDSLAEIFKDAYRNEAQAAKTTFRCYITKTFDSKQLIPIGTRITVDGDITFETTENLYIQPGKLYGDVAAVCQIPGAIGNNFVAGQITQIVDVYPYYDKIENITTSEGGAEEETDDEFYNRMRESMESFSTAGPAGAYEYFAKQASSSIADAKADTPEPGIVDIRILLKGGELPENEIINAVKETLSADRIRPLTDFIKVSTPETVSFDVDIAYYISTLSADSAAVIAHDVEVAVEEYKIWQSEKMGRDINPSYLVSLLMNTGIKRVEITQPNYTIVANNSVAIANNTNILNGGLEDE